MAENEGKRSGIAVQLILNCSYGSLTESIRSMPCKVTVWLTALVLEQTVRNFLKIICNLRSAYFCEVHILVIIFVPWARYIYIYIYVCVCVYIYML